MGAAGLAGAAPRADPGHGRARTSTCSAPWPTSKTPAAPRVSTTVLADAARRSDTVSAAAGSACRSASGSGSGWPACSAPPRRCCCSTNRPRTWTPHRAPRAAPPSSARAAPARPWWSSATGRRCWPSATSRASSRCDPCSRLIPCSPRRRTAAPAATPAAAAIVFGVLSLGSALALAGVSAWLITRAWQMPPVLDLTVAVVAVRALGISRGVLGYCERLASHDTALRAAGTRPDRLYRATGERPGRRRDAAGTAASWCPRSVHRSTNWPTCSCAQWSRLRWPPSCRSAAVIAVAVISPAAAAMLAVCLLVAGVAAPWLAARAAIAQRQLAAQHHSERDTAAMLALEHAPELRVSGPPRSASSPKPTGSNATGATQSTGRPAPLRWRGCADGGGRRQRARRRRRGDRVGVDRGARPRVAILMLLPLSAFEATTALPGRRRTAGPLPPRRSTPCTRSQRRPRSTHGGRRPAGSARPGRPAGRHRAQRRGQDDAADEPSPRLLPDETPSTAAFFAEDAHLFSTTVRDNLLVARGDATDDELTRALAAWAWADGSSAARRAGHRAHRRRRSSLGRTAQATPAGPRAGLDGADRVARRADRTPRRRGRPAAPHRAAHSRRSFRRRPHRRRRHPPPARRPWLSHRRLPVAVISAT